MPMRLLEPYTRLQDSPTPLSCLFLECINIFSEVIVDSNNSTIIPPPLSTFQKLKGFAHDDSLEESSHGGLRPPRNFSKVRDFEKG